MDRKTIINDAKKRMESALTSVHHNLSGLRTGRASANLLDHVVVEAYNDRMPISQLATITVPESRMLHVQVWDISTAKAVEKAIVAANLGVTPIAEGQMIRVPLPALSEERRKDLSKLAHEYGENGRIAIRNVRRDAIDEGKKLEKAKTISEDEMRGITDDIQKVTDQFSAKIDEQIKAKVAEIMQV